MTVERNLKSVLDWVESVDGEPVATLARFALQLDDLPIWPVWGDAQTDLEVFVDDLLSYLTTNWDELLLQQVYPSGLNPQRPSLLRSAAESAAAYGARTPQSEELMEAVSSFTQAHDLARCFGGIYDLPALWFLRQGRDVLIETSDRVECVPLHNWLSFANSLGDVIAARLLERQPNKWQKLVDAWHARDRGDPIRIAALATGQPEGVASKLIDERLVPNTTSVSEAANDNDGLRIAARMIGAIPYPAIQSVLTAAKAVPHKNSPKLDEFRQELAEEMAKLPESAYPYEQGVHASSWVREKCELEPLSRCDPLETLEHLGVPVFERNIGPATLDALAIWGDAHGPAVIVNLASRRLSNSAGRLSRRGLKISTAHELCHLLLDYTRTLAAVDILGSRMPLAAEQRANAFAAEFLLPARTAAEMWRQSDLAQTYDGLSTFLNRLSDRFDVSRTVAGWQLDHGLAGSNPEIVFLLDELLDRR